MDDQDEAGQQDDQMRWVGKEPIRQSGNHAEPDHHWQQASECAA